MAAQELGSELEPKNLYEKLSVVDAFACNWQGKKRGGFIGFTGHQPSLSCDSQDPVGDLVSKEGRHTL